MPTELQKKRNELHEKVEELKAVFDEAGPEKDFSKVTLLGSEVKSNIDKIGKVQQMNKNLKALGAEVDRLVEVETLDADVKKMGEYLTMGRGIEMPQGNLANPNIQGMGLDMPMKSIGDEFLKSKAYTERADHISSDFRMDMPVKNVKTLFETSAGFSPESIRSGLIIPIVSRPIQVTDVIPQGAINQAAEVYMSQNLRTNTAAETAEGAAYKEATITYEQLSETVRKITISIPVTDEQLEDEARVSSLLDDDLKLMVMQTLDTQIINGDGTGITLLGYINKSGVQTQTIGAGTSTDAFFTAMTKTRVTGRAIPTAHMIHPTDWQNIKLEKTADGIYLWGHPSEATVDRLWGLQVVQADALTLGTGLTGDFSNPTYSQLLIRRGLTVKVSDSNNDDFTKGKMTIRVDIRVVHVIRRAAAFVITTGLVA